GRTATDALSALAAQASSVGRFGFRCRVRVIGGTRPCVAEWCERGKGKEELSPCRKKKNKSGDESPHSKLRKKTSRVSSLPPRHYQTACATASPRSPAG